MRRGLRAGDRVRRRRPRPRPRPSARSTRIGEDLVEAERMLPGRRRPRRRRPDRLDDGRQCGGGVLDGRPGCRADRAGGSRGRRARWSSVERVERAPSVSTSMTSPPQRLPAQLVRRAPSAMSRPSAISATASHSSASLTYWVVTRIVRPASRSRWSSSQTVPRRIGSMPAVGSSRNSSVGLVDERAGELEAALHPARQVARPGGRGRPTARASSRTSRVRRRRRRQSMPEQAADEVDVLARRSGPGRA